MRNPFIKRPLDARPSVWKCLAAGGGSHNMRTLGAAGTLSQRSRHEQDASSSSVLWSSTIRLCSKTLTEPVI